MNKRAMPKGSEADSMKQGWSEKRILAVTALLCAGMVCAVYVALGVWPFGPNTVVTGDLGGQYLNYFAHMRRSLLDGLSGWGYTFEKGLGGNLMGILAYYCASPFHVLYFFFDPRYYTEIAALVLLCKVTAAGTAMAFFLERRFPQLRHRAILPALGYAFCAWAFVYSQNIMWHDVWLLLPLVCYGIWTLCRTGRPFVFAVSLALAIFSNFYIAYMACIFCVLYFFWELWAGGHELDRRTCVRRCVGFGFGALCGGGLPAFLLVPALLDVQQNKGMSGSFSITGETSFKASEFFYRLMPGNFDWSNVEAGLPNVYCGTLVVVLVIVYFCARGISLREKLASAAVLGILFASLYSRDLMLLFHGLTPPVWFPYRNSFLFSFWLCFLAGRALVSPCLNAWRLACAGGAGLGFLAVCFLVRHEWYTATLFVAGGALCAVGAVCVVCLRASRRAVRAGALVVCGVLCVLELTWNSADVLSRFEQYPRQDYLDFYDETSAAVEYTEHLDEGARMEKTFQRSYNDPMLLGYHGVSHFGSTQDSANTDWLSAMGFSDLNGYRSGGTAFGEALIGLKYLLAREGDSLQPHYVFAGQAGETSLQLWQNPYALPVGFFADVQALEQTIPVCEEGQDVFDVQNALFRALSGEDALLLEDLSVSGPTGRLTGQQEYTASVPKDGIVYAVWEGDEALPVEIPDAVGAQPGIWYTWGVVCLGEYSAGDTVRAQVQAVYEEMELTGVRFCVLDTGRLKAFCDRASQNVQQTQLEIGTFRAQVQADGQSLYVISVPWSQALRCTVDGQPVSVHRLADGLCAVELTAGEQSLELGWTVPGATWGLCLSAAAAAMLAALWLFGRKKNKGGESHVHLHHR